MHRLTPTLLLSALFTTMAAPSIAWADAAPSPKPVASPARAGAAADPFADFEATNPDVTPVSEIAVPAPVASSEIAVPTRRGTLSFGGIASFDYSGSNLEALDGSSISNSNFFARAGGRGSYMVTDRFDVGGTLGILWRDAGRGTSQSGGFLELNAGYLVPLVPRVALAPRVGLGFYRGGAERDLVVAGNRATESTTVNGLTATLYLMGAFQASPSLQVRSGLALTSLVGWESVASADRTLSSTSFLVGIPIEIDWTR